VGVQRGEGSEWREGIVKASVCLDGIFSLTFSAFPIFRLRMGCCKENSRRYLKLVNAILILIGLAVVALGIYGILEVREVLENINGIAPFAAFILGAVIILAAGLGLYGATKQSKPSLFLYFLVAFALTALVLAFGAIVLIYVGLLDDIPTGQEQISEAAGQVNDFEMAIYRDCCFAENFTSVEIPLCDENITTPGCIVNEEDFNNFQISDSFCKALEEVKIGSVNVVGPLPSACETPETFSSAFSTFVEDNLIPIGASLIALALIMILCVIASCVLICTNRYEYDKDYRARVQQQGGQGGPVVQRA